MTYIITGPMPECGAMSHGFEPQRVDYLSPEVGARVGSISAGWPLWHLAIDLNNLKPNVADIWRAWVPGQRGSSRLFYARDLSRDVPRFHTSGRPYIARPTGGWSQAIDANGDAVLTLAGAQPSMVLSLGDYVGFEWGTFQRSLVRVVKRGIADGSGTIAVTVEPPVHAVTPSNAAVNLDKPTCLMRLVTPGTDLGRQMYGGLYTAAGGKIEALQDLIP